MLNRLPCSLQQSVKSSADLACSLDLQSRNGKREMKREVVRSSPMSNSKSYPQNTEHCPFFFPSQLILGRQDATLSDGSKAVAGGGSWNMQENIPKNTSSHFDHISCRGQNLPLSIGILLWGIIITERCLHIVQSCIFNLCGSSS